MEGVEMELVKSFKDQKEYFLEALYEKKWSDSFDNNIKLFLLICYFCGKSLSARRNYVFINLDEPN